MSMLSRFPTTATAGIQYVGGTTAAITASISTTTNVSLTGLTGGLASAPAQNDLVIVYYGVGSNGDEVIGVTTSGYTEVSELFISDTYSANLSVSYKTMGATPDTQVTVSGTGSTNNAGAVAIQVWRYVDAVLPLNVASTTATGINSVLCNPPSITPTAPGAVIIAGGAGGHNAGIQTYSSSDLQNFISVGGPNTTNDVTVGMGSRAGIAGTAFDPAAFTFSAGDSPQYSWAAVTLALRPNQNQVGPYPIAQATTQNTSNGTSLVINKPTGTREGDLMVAYLLGGGGTQSSPGWSGPTGWTYAVNIVGGANGRPFNAIAYKVAGASEGASYTFTANTSRTLAGTIATYRNAAYDASGANTSGLSPLVVTAVTASVDFARVIGIAGRDAASITITGPATMDSIITQADATAPSWLIEQDQTVSLSGSSGTRSFVVGSTTNVNGILHTVKPATSYTKYAQYIANTTAGPVTTDITINTVSCVPGNLLLMVASNVSSSNFGETFVTPTGWTLLRSYVGTANFDPSFSIFYRVADGSEAASYVVDVSSPNTLSGAMICLAGVDSDTITSAIAARASSTTSCVAPSLTATANGVLLYFAFGSNNNLGQPTFTPPSGMTEIFDIGNNGTSTDYALTMGYLEGVTAGATGTKTATSSLTLTYAHAVSIFVGAK